MEGRSVVLAKSARAAMRKAAQAQFPEEACGVLLGDCEGGKVCVSALFSAPNRARADRDLQFILSPYDMHRASRQARDYGCDIVGFFHSHPRGVAQPSAQDWRESNPWPGYVHLIAALDDNLNHELTAWCYQPNGWRQDALEDA